MNIPAYIGAPLIIVVALGIGVALAMWRQRAGGVKGSKVIK